MVDSFNPDSWMDVVAYLVIGIPATVAAIATFRGQQQQKKIHAEQQDVAEKTLYEVRNDHRTNLRDDIDHLAIAINNGFAEVRRDVHQLRQDLGHERVERIEGDRRKD